LALRDEYFQHQVLLNQLNKFIYIEGEENASIQFRSSFDRVRRYNTTSSKYYLKNIYELHLKFKENSYKIL